jgi:hypothetical protein
MSQKCQFFLACFRLAQKTSTFPHTQLSRATVAGRRQATNFYISRRQADNLTDSLTPLCCGILWFL